ncbi:MAG: SIS domain-containing protein [Betaproteobacteria bacterium]
MTLFDIDLAEWTARGGQWTAREISQQPRVWGLAGELLAGDGGIALALRRLLERRELRIVLTGAGTSAFIGECLAPALTQHLGRRVDAVSTTDLVAGPQRWLQRDVPTLLVSFARSGSSPESVAAVTLADQFVEQCHHLVLTCNEAGELCAQGRAHPRGLVLVLPEESHDRGFAMTSSFTSLLLTAASLFGVLDAAPAAIAHLGAAARDALARGLPLARDLVAQKFERVIYLGSNEFKGLAREGALKLLELTDGAIVANFDSPLGFRHGPKTIVNARTLVVLFVSNDPYTRQYDLDLLHELRADGHAGRVLALSGREDGLDVEAGDLVVAGMARASDLECALPLAAFFQLFALLQSMAHGLTPDNPSVSGTVTRVVHGVTIYPC